MEFQNFSLGICLLAVAGTEVQCSMGSPKELSFFYVGLSWELFSHKCVLWEKLHLKWNSQHVLTVCITSGKGNDSFKKGRQTFISAFGRVYAATTATKMEGGGALDKMFNLFKKSYCTLKSTANYPHVQGAALLMKMSRGAKVTPSVCIVACHTSPNVKAQSCFDSLWIKARLATFCPSQCPGSSFLDTQQWSVFLRGEMQLHWSQVITGGGAWLQGLE